MLKSESLQALFALKSVRGIAACFFHLALTIGTVTPALAQQDFSLQMGAFSPFAMNPGGSAQSNVTLNPLNGFSGSVDLTCTVAPAGPTAPGCVISPGSVTPPGTATATVSSILSTGGTATPGDYTITVTGTSGTLVHPSSGDVSVLSVTAQFTITVTSVTAPSSVPAGTGAQATISVNPISGYSGTVTLSCSSTTPVVLVPPVCTFDYPPTSPTGLPVNGTPATVNLTINTTGPIPTPSRASVARRASWAFWLPFPVIGLALLGGAVSGKRFRLSFTFLGIVTIASAFLILPACGNSSNSTTSTNPNGNTPSNTYTFTLTGVDQNGNISSNTGVNNSAATVSLTVTAPAQ